MTSKKFFRAVCTVALAGACLAAPALSGCNTDHPEATITLSFNGKDYALDYKMYRNMYPQTVLHFIELADNGFYDQTVVHNYTSSSWICGGYTYYEPAEEGDTSGYVESFARGKDDFREYLEKQSKESAYVTLADPAAGKITPSVYKDMIDGKYSQPLNTLIGEFSNNQHKIEKGALRSSYGCLRMYYTSKSMDSVKNERVYLDKQGSPMGLLGSYNYNSATSMFSIQPNSTTTTDSNYAIFAEIKEKSKEVLDELKKDISEYLTKIGSNNFTMSVNLYVDNYDEYVGALKNEVSYTATSLPIVIKSVKITKY